MGRVRLCWALSLVTSSESLCCRQVVLSKGVDEGKILFLSLIAAPEGIHMVCKKFPRVKVITSEIDEGIDDSTFQVVPGNTFILG